MTTMSPLTRKQEAVWKFVDSELKAGRASPTHREIAAHFGFSSPNAAAKHLKALAKKGFLVVEGGKARALRTLRFPGVERATTAEIPLFGSIPAGFGDERSQEPDGCITVDIATIEFKPTSRTYALKVVGDSMIGRHICDGDIVILEHNAEPRNGDIVAAYIDRKSTLKTFVKKGNRCFLKAENPKYPNLIPSEELVIHGVFKGLIRKA
jgi:repressor LexA